MIFTKELFEKGKSSNGGYNNQQLDCLGVDYKVAGWKHLVIGKELPDEKVKEFISLKDAHFKNRLKNGGKVKAKIKNKMGILNFAPVPKPLTFQEQYLHPNWQMMRVHVFTRDKFTCVNCGAIDKTLHAHHLKYIRDKYVWQVPAWYIVTLCEDCHSMEHGRDLRAKIN